MIRKIALTLLAGIVAMHSADAWSQEAPEAVEAVEAVEADEAVETDEANEAAAEQAEDPNDVSNDYLRELLTLEEEVNALKESVFRSKATLQLLKEIVVEGSTTGSRVALWHVNELGSSYNVVSVTYFLNGQPIFTRTDENGELGDSEEIKIWEGALPPGSHGITVNAVLRGNGFGVFSYVEDYTFNVRSSYTFNAEDNHLSTVRVLIDERSGIGRSFIERPQVEYEIQSTRLTEGD
jgi:hypothetical protein